jgi:hypothetical protein
MNRIVFFIGVLLMYGCATQKNTEVEKVIYFGSGGGFTGKVKTFVLSSSGSIYLLESPEKKYKARASKKERKQIFEKAKELKIKIVGYSAPGNIYYFINLGDIRNAPDYIWGNSKESAPPEILDLYNKMVAMIPKMDN